MLPDVELLAGAVDADPDSFFGAAEADDPDDEPESEDPEEPDEPLDDEPLDEPGEELAAARESVR